MGSAHLTAGLLGKRPSQRHDCRTQTREDNDSRSRNDDSDRHAYHVVRTALKSIKLVILPIHFFSKRFDIFAHTADFVAQSRSSEVQLDPLNLCTAKDAALILCLSRLGNAVKQVRDFMFITSAMENDK